MLSGLELVVAVLVVFVGAVVMGMVSFGMGLVVAPVLLLFVEPQATVVIVNAVIAILLSLVLVQTFRHLKLRSIWPMALGGLCAVPIGVLVLSVADPAALRITIGLVILVLGILNIFHIQLPLVRYRWAGAAFGFLTSLAVTTLGIGGPLAALYVVAQRWSPQEIRASLAFFFLLSYVVAFGLYAKSGLVHRETLANIAILIPSLVFGFGLATLLVRRMDQKVFRYAVTGVIITGSLVLLSKEIVGR